MNFFLSNFLDKAKFDFVRYKILSFLFSIFLITSSVLLLFYNGINFGIDFTGGLVFEIKTQNSIDLQKLKSRLFEALEANNFVAYYTEDQNGAVIKIKSNNNQEDVKIIKSALLYLSPEYQKIDYVGPQISKNIIKSGMIAVAFAFIGILIYLILRFDLRFGISGIITLIHDAIIVLGIYSLFAIEFCSSSVAAILTVIGYSINDSVVIFDRIRESSRIIKKNAELINTSINKTLSRTVLTSFTTIISILPIIFFCSGEVADFAKIILAGITIGTYSSIFISAPITLFSK